MEKKLANFQEIFGIFLSSHHSKHAQPINVSENISKRIRSVYILFSNAKLKLCFFYFLFPRNIFHIFTFLLFCNPLLGSILRFAIIK